MTRVGSVDVDGTLVVVFLDEDSGRTIEFQGRLGEEDPQDVELRHLGVCVVVDGGPVVYDGIEGWHLTPDWFTFTLTEEAAAALGLPRENRLSLAGAEPGATGSLRQVLRRPA